jgi:cytochrome c oxidase subunit I
MRRGALAIGLPLLWAMGGVAVLAMAGLSAIVVSAVFTANHALQDTYYVVAHWDHAIGVAAVFGVFAGWYCLFPRVTGWSYSVLLGKIHFWLTFIGIGAGIVTTGFVLRALTAYEAGRIVDVPDAFRYVNLVSRTGSSVAAVGTLVFFINMALALWRRRPAH